MLAYLCKIDLVPVFAIILLYSHRLTDLSVISRMAAITLLNNKFQIP